MLYFIDYANSNSRSHTNSISVLMMFTACCQMAQITTESAEFTGSSQDLTRKQEHINKNNNKNNNSVDNNNIKESTRFSELNEFDNRERS